MTALAILAAFIVALEFCKAGWHGRWQGDLGLATAHLVTIGAIHTVVFRHSPWVLYGVMSLSLVATAASYYILLKSYILLKGRTGWWWEPLWYKIQHFHRGSPHEVWTEWTRSPLSGTNLYLRHPDCIQRPIFDRWHVMSWLSSWPVELAAIYALTVPLWGQWPHFAAACGLWLGTAALCRWGIWRNPRLRPRHWR